MSNILTYYIYMLIKVSTPKRLRFGTPRKFTPMAGTSSMSKRLKRGTSNKAKALLVSSRYSQMFQLLVTQSRKAKVNFCMSNLINIISEEMHDDKTFS